MNAALDGPGKIVVMRIVESVVIGSIAIGASLYVGVNVLGVRIQNLENAIAEQRLDLKSLDSTVDNLRVDTASLLRAESTSDKMMQQIQDRLTNISSRVRDLESTRPRAMP